MYLLLSFLKKFTAYFLASFIALCYLVFSQPLFSQVNKSVYHPTPAKRDAAKKFQQKKLAVFYSKNSPGSKNFANNVPPATSYYVNDNSLTGDHYTLAPGNDLFPGTAA